MATSDGFATDDPVGHPQTDRLPSASPLHAPGELTLDATIPLRQQCWDSLDAALRDRLHELSGTVIDWWALQITGLGSLPMAVVFGEAGLFIADPPNPGSGPAYSISGYEIVSGSLTSDAVDHNPPPDEVRPEVDADSEASEALGSGIEGLTPRFKAVLGNLPPRAQQLLQAPFAAGQQIHRNDFHYEGYPHHLEVFVLYLAGAEDLTVATGTKLIPDGHSDATAHWSLQIHRALVNFRPGD